MATELPAKRVKTSPLAIGTHNGHFHADEALAVYLLRILPTYAGSSLVRTRDPSLLSQCHTVVDVGGEYDDASRRYDHHQRGFSTKFPGREATPLSSAGLIWLHYGRDVIAQHTGLEKEADVTGLLWNKLYDDFVEAVDANDNGVSPYDPEIVGQAKFKTHGVTLASLVSDLNHEFDPDTSVDQVDKKPEAEKTGEASQAVEDARFLRASKLMGSSFLRKLHGLFTVWVPARATVAEAFEARRLLDSEGRLMMMPSGGIPWKEHLYALEGAESAAVAAASTPPKDYKVRYVLYPESADEGLRWRVQAVSVSIDSFISRLPLPEAWRGLRDEELSKESGILGCVFVHASGFIGGNLTKEGALSMARRSLEMHS